MAEHNGLRDAECEAIILRYRDDLSGIRTGRAHTGLVENILVEGYGSVSPLKQVATITTPEARLIVVQPWDRTLIGAIETAIRSANLGLNPVNDGAVVRIPLPILTEERRRELVRVLGTRTESARIAVRGVRDTLWKKLQEDERAGVITEDEKFRGKDKLQEQIDKVMSTIEDLRAKKEKEIMTV